MIIFDCGVQHQLGGYPTIMKLHAFDVLALGLYPSGRRGSDQGGLQWPSHGRRRLARYAAVSAKDESPAAVRAQAGGHIRGRLGVACNNSLLYVTVVRPGRIWTTLRARDALFETVSTTRTG